MVWQDHCVTLHNTYFSHKCVLLTRMYNQRKWLFSGEVMSEIEYLSLKDYLVFSCVWLYLQNNIQQDIRRIIFLFCVFF